MVFQGRHSNLEYAKIAAVVSIIGPPANPGMPTVEYMEQLKQYGIDPLLAFAPGGYFSQQQQDNLQKATLSRKSLDKLVELDIAHMRELVKGLGLGGFGTGHTKKYLPQFRAQLRSDYECRYRIVD